MVQPPKHVRRSRRRTVLEHGPHPVDVHVGAQLRKARMWAGLSQDELARAVGLTFQQLQKYEAGANRISASRLFEFATLTERPISFFFAGLDGESGDDGAGVDAVHLAGKNPFRRRETLELVRCFSVIASQPLRRNLIETVADIADTLSSTGPRRPPSRAVENAR